MAIISTGLFFFVPIADLTGEASTLRFDVNTAHPKQSDLATFSGNTAHIANLLAKIQACSKGLILGYSIGEKFVENGLAYGLGDKDDKAICTAAIAGIAGKTGTFYIPAPADTIFIGDAAAGPDAEKLDSADPALIEYANLFSVTVLDDPLVPSGCFLISDGEQFEATPVTVTGRKI